MVAKPGGAGVDFETDQPIIMENTEREATVAQLIVLDPDLHEEMTVLLSSSVVGVGSMSCLSLTKVTTIVAALCLPSTSLFPLELSIHLKQYRHDEWKRNRFLIFVE